MSLEKIIDKILKDAKDEAVRIEDEARGKANAILNEAKREASSLKEVILKQAGLQTEKEKRGILSMARLQAKKEILAQKQSLLDEVFQRTKERILNFGNKEYQELMGRLIFSSLQTGKEEVVFSKKDKFRITAEFIKRIKPSLKISYREDIEGGFILKEKDVLVDNRLQSILDNLREGIQPELVKILEL